MPLFSHTSISWEKSYKDLHIYRPRRNFAPLENTKCVHVFAIASAFSTSPNYFKIGTINLTIH